jgi:hypothetical protein
MGQYLFRFPENTPRFDYDSLAAWMGDDYSRKIGTTVQVNRLFTGEGHFVVYLYDFLIADIGRESIEFLPDGDDGHKATTEWIAAIARHNGIAGVASRRRRKLYPDGEGPMTARGMAGVLVFWGRQGTHTREPGESQVVGRDYPVDLSLRDETLQWWERQQEPARA